jgi:hypothetical protein
VENRGRKAEGDRGRTGIRAAREIRAEKGEKADRD